jgi:UDP-N-acetylmuramate--alanine ligase
MPLRRSYRVHFVGIGGIGMSGIAEVLVNLGYQVSGSDLVASETTLRLENLGARVAVGHRSENLGEADVVVTSSAVGEDNPEVGEARRRGVPVIQRAEMLAELMRMKYSIAVAGSHGKTTTTSIMASIMAEAGLDPTIVIGGRLNSLGSNACLGQGEFLVAEADESDGSFLKLTPTYAIVTNIDPEHLDHYKTVERLRAAFIEFANKVPFYGLVVACLDHPVVQDILPRIGKRLATYGIDSGADYRATQLSFATDCVRFEVLRRGEPLGPVELRMIGEHNVLNALSTIAVAEELQVPFDVVQRALSRFEGVQRRFTIRGCEAGVTVVDDYGHHPVEIRATLSGARKAYANRLVVVFQPHRYSRTRDLEREFYSAFDRADALVVMDIYAAGEKPIEGVNAQMLYRGIRNHGPREAHYISDREHVVDWLLSNTHPSDLVITMGAGDVWRVGEELLARLRRQRNGQGGPQR